MNIFLFLIVLFTFTSCGHSMRRSTAGAGWQTVHLSKSEMEEKLEDEIKVVDEAIKKCQKRKMKLKMINPSHRFSLVSNVNSKIGVDNSTNYKFTKSKMLCVAN